MITRSPSGALSPYYYKGGYFHGIHYGSYFQDTDALLSMMRKEEAFLLASPEKRRILIDLYETELTASLLEQFVAHIGRLTPRIIKLAVTCEKKELKLLRRALMKSNILPKGRVYFCTDMEEGKTWLVSD